MLERNQPHLCTAVCIIIIIIIIINFIIIIIIILTTADNLMPQNESGFLSMLVSVSVEYPRSTYQTGGILIGAGRLK